MWLRRIGWAALALATLAIAVGPDLIRLPRPDGAIVLDRATLMTGDDAGREVALPHVTFPGPGNPHYIRYVLGVDASAQPGEALFLYIPLVNRRISMEVDGRTFYDSGPETLWTGPVVGTPILERLPRPAGDDGRQRLTLVVHADRFAAPAYLSQVYLGTEAQVVPSYRWRTLLDVDLKDLSFAVQLMLAIGVIVAYLATRKSALLLWLAVFEAVTIVNLIGMFMGFQPALRDWIPYIVAFVPAWGVLSVCVAIVLIGRRPPRALTVGIVIVTAGLLLFTSTGAPFARIATSLTAAVSICAGAVAGTAVVVWGALRLRNVDAHYMLGPAVLTSWFLLRDGYVAATLPDHAFRLYSPHAGLIFVAGILAVMVRRMSSSFDQLDRSNEILNAKLAQREAELAALAQQEQIEATRLVRAHERQRLTHDLHDGISGHLVSIIALSERAETRPIEQAAREALNDLRLVIYSLDLGDAELILALANFRERLIPQLHRLGLELDWSMANLPDVTGVTPGNALAVLRIVQEAITNALKHGPARRISIRGSAAADGMAAITIENDGRPFVADSGGRGLDNMRRRADGLGARLCLESLEHGTRVTLLLPGHLPDVEA